MLKKTLDGGPYTFKVFLQEIINGTQVLRMCFNDLFSLYQNLYVRLEANVILNRCRLRAAVSCEIPITKQIFFEDNFMQNIVSQ